MQTHTKIFDLFQTKDFVGSRLGKDSFSKLLQLQHYCTELHNNPSDISLTNRILKSQVDQIIKHETYKTDPYAFMLAFVTTIAAHSNNSDADITEHYLSELRQHLLANSGWIEDNPLLREYKGITTGKSFTLFGSHVFRGENDYLPYLYDSGKRTNLRDIFDDILYKVAGNDAKNLKPIDRTRFATIIFEAFTNCLIHAAQTGADQVDGFLPNRANFWTLSFRRVVIDKRLNKSEKRKLIRTRFGPFPELFNYIMGDANNGVKFYIFASVFDDGPGIVEHYMSKRDVDSPSEKGPYLTELSRLRTH